MIASWSYRGLRCLLLAGGLAWVIVTIWYQQPDFRSFITQPSPKWDVVQHNMRLYLSLPLGVLAAFTSASLEKRAAIDDCLSTAGVPTDARGSTAWNQDVAPFNTRLPYTPVAIVVPSTVTHIQAAVSCAAKLGIKVNPKSGGHSYASFGLGGENGHLVVELDRMNNVTVDKTTKIATVAAGARLGHIATVLNQQGSLAISHGTCPGVGVGGHALHGGFGFSSHTHGLALDWIAGATVVLANATVVNCSATENPDLFWAIRGAGSSFGIVTSFRFNTFAQPPVVTTFTINLPWNNAQQAAAGWTALQNWTADSMPAELNMRVFGSSWSTQLQGQYYGTQTNLKTAITPLMTLLNASSSALGNVKESDYMGGFVSYANGDNTDPSHPYSLQELFFSKSLVTSALPPAAMKAATEYWFSKAKQVSRAWFIIIDMYGGKNAAIPKVANNATAYPHRDKLFLYEFYDRQYAGAYPSNGFDFLNGWVKSFTDNLTRDQWGMYINYADPTMNQTEAQVNYYRDNLPRLQQVKAQVDPTELFYYPQAIRPAGK